MRRLRQLHYFLEDNPRLAYSLLVILVMILLLLLSGCKAMPAPVRIQIKEVPVETMIPIPAQLTAQIPAPSRPANRCKDDRGRSTICNRDLADWLNGYAAALDKANARLREILGLQPKP